MLYDSHSMKYSLPKDYIGVFDHSSTAVGFSVRIFTIREILNLFGDSYKGIPVERMVRMSRISALVPGWIKGDLEKSCVAASEIKIRNLQGDLDATQTFALTTDVD